MRHGRSLRWELSAVRERFEAIYAAALADILDARGFHHQTLPPSIRPLERGTRLAGPAYTVKGGPASNPDAAAYDGAIRKVLRMLGDVLDASREITDRYRARLTERR